MDVLDVLIARKLNGGSGGSGGVTLPELSTPAVESDIYTGKEAIDGGGGKLTGTNPYNAANVDPAVASALTALAEKGVDTAGADLFDLASLISAISVGGGGGASVYYCSVTMAEDGNTIEVTHNLSKIPDLITVAHSPIQPFPLKDVFLIVANSKEGMRSVPITSANPYRAEFFPRVEAWGINQDEFVTATETTAKISVPSATMTFSAGVTYHIYCGVSE